MALKPVAMRAAFMLGLSLAGASPGGTWAVDQAADQTVTSGPGAAAPASALPACAAPCTAPQPDWQAGCGQDGVALWLLRITADGQAYVQHDAHALGTQAFGQALGQFALSPEAMAALAQHMPAHEWAQLPQRLAPSPLPLHAPGYWVVRGSGLASHRVQVQAPALLPPSDALARFGQVWHTLWASVPLRPEPPGLPSPSPAPQAASAEPASPAPSTDAAEPADEAHAPAWGDTAVAAFWQAPDDSGSSWQLSLMPNGMAYVNYQSHSPLGQLHGRYFLAPADLRAVAAQARAWRFDALPRQLGAPGPAAQAPSHALTVHTQGRTLQLELHPGASADERARFAALWQTVWRRLPLRPPAP